MCSLNVGSCQAQVTDTRRVCASGEFLSEDNQQIDWASGQQSYLKLPYFNTATCVNFDGTASVVSQSDQLCESM